MYRGLFKQTLANYGNNSTQNTETHLDWQVIRLLHSLSQGWSTWFQQSLNWDQIWISCTQKGDPTYVICITGAAVCCPYASNPLNTVQLYKDLQADDEVKTWSIPSTQVPPHYVVNPFDRKMGSSGPCVAIRCTWFSCATYYNLQEHLLTPTSFCQNLMRSNASMGRTFPHSLRLSSTDCSRHLISGKEVISLLELNQYTHICLWMQKHGWLIICTVRWWPKGCHTHLTQITRCWL